MPAVSPEIARAFRLYSFQKDLNLFRLGDLPWRDWKILEIISAERARQEAENSRLREQYRKHCQDSEKPLKFEEFRKWLRKEK